MYGITGRFVFETALGTVVLAAKGHNNDWYCVQNPEMAGKALSKINSSTLGGILKDLKRELSFGEDGSLVAQFERGLLARNRLFHGFFESHAYKIQTDEGRDEMIVDHEELHDELFRCWRVAEGIAAALTEELFVSLNVAGDEGM